MEFDGAALKNLLLGLFQKTEGIKIAEDLFVPKAGDEHGILQAVGAQEVLGKVPFQIAEDFYPWVFFIRKICMAAALVQDIDIPLGGGELPAVVQYRAMPPDDIFHNGHIGDVALAVIGPVAVRDAGELHKERRGEPLCIKEAEIFFQIILHTFLLFILFNMQ